jgi:integrase
MPQDTHTVAGLVSAYLEHAATYYAGSREYANLRATLRRLARHAPDTPAASFRSSALIGWRDGLVAGGTISRPHINRMVHQVRRMYRWAVESELVAPDTLTSLQAVRPLKAGRTSAPEPTPVRGVSVDDIRATIPHLPPTVGAMVELMRLTGARTGEVRQMRAGEIEMATPVWIFRPSSHKSAHHGKSRQIPLDDPCQAIVMPRLLPFVPDSFVFPSTHGGCYAEGSIRNAVAIACKRAGVARWHPHQIRHAYLTAVRHALPDDPDAWRAAAGHEHLRTTEIYAAADTRRAIAAQAAVRLRGG